MLLPPMSMHPGLQPYRRWQRHPFSKAHDVKKALDSPATCIALLADRHVQANSSARSTGSSAIAIAAAVVRAPFPWSPQLPIDDCVASGSVTGVGLCRACARFASLDIRPMSTESRQPTRTSRTASRLDDSISREHSLCAPHFQKGDPAILCQINLLALNLDKRCLPGQ